MFLTNVFYLGLQWQNQPRTLLDSMLIVKPWSKSWSQQAPKSNKSPPKKEIKKDLDLGLTLRSHGPPPHPTPPITFKHKGVLW